MPSAAADAPSTGSLERDLDLEADLDLDRSAIVCECVWVVVGQSFKKKGRIGTQEMKTLANLVCGSEF